MGPVLKKVGGTGWGGYPSSANQPDDGEAAAAAAAAEKEAEEAERKRAHAEEAERKAKAAVDEERRRAAAEKAARRKAAKEEAERRRRQQEQQANKEAAAAAAAPSSQDTSADDSQKINIQEPASLEEAIATSKTLLSPLIKKPPLKDKLLTRPPAKFILDLILNVIKATGFLDGLYTPEELDQQEYKQQDKKLRNRMIAMFIKKTIKFTSLAIGSALPVNINDVMRGVEAAKTNMLFHALAKAAMANVSSDVIRSRMRGGKSKRDPSPSVRKPPESTTSEAEGGTADNSSSSSSSNKPQQQEERSSKRSTRSSGGDTGSSNKEATDLRQLALSAAAEGTNDKAVAMPKLNIGNITSKPADEATAAYHKAAEEEEREMRSARPTTRPMTARRAPPKVRSHLVEEKKTIADMDKESTGLITEDNAGEDLEEEDDDDDDDGLGIKMEAGQPNANERHGKLVSDILRFQNKHERKDGNDESKADDDGTQFRFGRLKKKSGGASNFYSEEQIIFLREKIQALCQSATPLGKCIDYVCEDMESMNKELAQWTRVYDAEKEVQKEASKTTEGSLAPLRQTLADLDKEILQEQESTVKLQAQIIMNERVIDGCLKTLSGM